MNKGTRQKENIKQKLYSKTAHGKVTKIKSKKRHNFFTAKFFLILRGLWLHSSSWSTVQIWKKLEFSSRHRFVELARIDPDKLWNKTLFYQFKGTAMRGCFSVYFTAMCTTPETNLLIIYPWYHQEAPPIATLPQKK